MRIELTVYKNDFALVSEKRPVALESGQSRLAIGEVSKQLDPDSVLFDWPASGRHPEVVATTYDLGVGNGSSLMNRLNGQQVDMMWPSNDGKPGETISGRLEAAQDGSNFALRTDEKLYVNPGGTIVAPAGTTGVDSAATLSIRGRMATAPPVLGSGLSYLTRGMSWSADYVAKLQPNSDTAEIQCWATVTNTTGIPYPAARLTLMAGAPNRAVMSNAMVPLGGLQVNGNLQYGQPLLRSDADVLGARMTNAPRMAIGRNLLHTRSPRQRRLVGTK